MARKIEIEIVGDARKLEREFKRAGDAGGRLGRSLKTAAKVGAIGLGVGLAGVALGARSAWQELVQAQKVTAQTEAVLKSTGGAANVTARDIDRLSASLLRKTGIDDEAIQSGANMLLTFTNVRNEAGKGNDIFNQATKSLLDMSTAMEGAGFEGGNLKTTAIRLGKALNDPVRGMSALRRVGVSFTKAQEEMVKGWVEHGDIVKAQKFILRELNVEFGGSARAFGKTLPGQITIFRERLKNVGADILQFLIPALTGAMEAVSGLAGFLGRIADAPSISVAIDIAKGGITSLGGRIKGAVEDSIRGTNWRDVGRELGSAISSGIVIGTAALDRFLGAAFSWLGSHAQQIAEFGAELLVRVALTLTDPAFWAKHTDLLALLIATGLGRGLGRHLVGLGRSLLGVVGRLFGGLAGRAMYAVMSGVARLPAVIGDAFAFGTALAGRAIGLLWSVFRRTVGFIFTELGKLPGALGAAFRFVFIAGFVRATLAAVDKLMGALSTMLGVIGKIPGPLTQPFRDAQKSIDNARERLRGFKDEMTGLKSKKVTVDVDIRIGGRTHDTAHGTGDGLAGAVSTATRAHIAANPFAFAPQGGGRGAGGLVAGIRDELGIGQQLGLTLTSGRRAPSRTSTGGWSLHGSGRAIDMAGHPWAMTRFAASVAGRPGVAEVIYSPLGAWYPGAGWVGISGQLARDHYSHVHVGVTGDGLLGTSTPWGDGLVGSRRKPRRPIARAARAGRKPRGRAGRIRVPDDPVRDLRRRFRRRPEPPEFHPPEPPEEVVLSLPASIEEAIFLADESGDVGQQIAARQAAVAWYDQAIAASTTPETRMPFRQERRRLLDEIRELSGEAAREKDAEATQAAQLEQAQRRASAAERALQLTEGAIGAGLFGGSTGGGLTIVQQNLVPDAAGARRAAEIITQALGAQGFVGSPTASLGL